MSVIANFNTAMNSSRRSPFSDPMKVINDAARRNFIAPNFLRGSGREILIQGGLAIEDVIFLEGTGNFRAYKPHEQQQVVNRQPGTKWKVPWSYYTDEMVWTDHEIESGLDAGLKDGVKIKRLKDIKLQKEMALYTSMLEGLDDLMFAVPNFSEMEHPTASTEDAESSYSIPALVNEFAGGLYVSTESGTWTSVQGVNHTNWMNQRVRYAKGSTTDETTGVLAAFRKMGRKVRFNKPGIRPELFTGRDQSQRDDVDAATIILTDDVGYDTYEAAILTNTQARYDATGVRRLDGGIAGLYHGGARIEEVEQLNGKALYPAASSTLADQANATDAGPRYWCLDRDYMCLAFKADRMFKKDEVRRPDRVYDTYYQAVTLWLNLVCKSRRRHGIIYPATNFGAD